MDRLYGRANELALLEAALGRADRGHGSVVLLSGEAGIGKSRLVKELAKIANDRGVTAAWGRCWEAGGAPAFWPWTQVFRALGRDPLREVHAVSDSGQRFDLFDAATRALADVARATPLLILLDDLHVADVPSLLLVLFMAREMEGMRVLIVGAARENHAWAEPEVGTLIGKIRREGEPLLLARLTAEDVTAWASSRGAPQAEDIYRVSEGNPLFVEELLRLGMSRGAAHFALAAVLDEHLSRLSSPARLVVEAISVLGRECTLDTLSATFGFDPDEVAQHANEAIAIGVLLLGDHGSYGFSHALLRDRLYGSLAPTRRAELHWKAGIAMQEADATKAHHLLEGCAAGNWEAAAKVAKEAARTTLDQLAYEEAATLAKRAQVVIPVRCMIGCELELLRAEALIRGGVAEEGREACKRAAVLATELDIPELFARAALVYGIDPSTVPSDNTMVALLGAALERLPPEPGALRVRVMARLALGLSPPNDEAAATRIVDMARASLAMARQLGDKETLLYSMNFGGPAVGYLIGFEERVGVIEEMVALARELGQRYWLERSIGFHIVTLVEQGRRAEANVELRAFEEMMKELPRMNRWRLLAVQSVLALLDGRLDDATRLSDESRTLGRPGSLVDFLWARQRILIAHASGDPASIARYEDEVLRLFSGRPGAPYAAWVLAAMGKQAEAAAALEAILRVDQRFPQVLVVGSACVLAKDIGLATRAYSALHRERHRGRVFWGPAGGIMVGPMSQVLGDLATLIGRREEASAHYDDAIALCRTMGAKPLLELAVRAREACGTRVKSPPPASVVMGPQLSLRREGDVWAIESGGSPLRLKHSKGFSYLEQLVAQAGREVHVLMLVGGEHGEGDAGAILDSRAKSQYKRRIELLDERIELARSLGDDQGVAKGREELDVLAEQLASAVGLGGRDRRAASNVERARINVQRRLKDAIDCVFAVDDALGRYLRATIKTGTFCSFLPQ